MSTKGNERLGEVLTRDDHLSSLPGAVEEVGETVSSLRLKNVYPDAAGGVWKGATWNAEL